MIDLSINQLIMFKTVLANVLEYVCDSNDASQVRWDDESQEWLGDDDYLCEMLGMLDSLYTRLNSEWIQKKEDDKKQPSWWDGNTK